MAFITMPAPSSAGALSFGMPAVETIQQYGSADTIIDLIIMGEGYTEAEFPLYASNVIELVEHIFSVSPFAENRSLFNIYKINVISADSGIDNPTKGIYADTAFDAEQNNTLILINHWENMIAASALAPETDIVIILANSPDWGGSANVRTAVSFNGSSLGTADHIFVHLSLHEFGHALGLLADEYDGIISGTPGNTYDFGEPTNVNATAETDSLLIKWQEHLGYEGVAMFSGALGFDNNVYRPTEHACIMRTLVDASGVLIPFCRVCQEDGLEFGE